MRIRLRKLLTLLALPVGAAMISCVAAAAVADDLEIKFDNHRFAPQTVTVPSGEALAVKVVNSSNEPIEFESFKLNREKVVTPGDTITVHLPALSPGTYDFYDDFHQDVPQGTIVAK